MIDADELVTEDAEAFTEQWLKLWHRATAILQGVGWTWPDEAGGDFSLDLMRPPEGRPLTRWAADLAEVDAAKAREFVADRPNVYITDAAAVLTSLAAIMDAIANASTERPQVRSAALWGLNAATYMLRHHGQLDALKSLSEANHGLALLTANVGTLATTVAEHQSEAQRIKDEAERLRQDAEAAQSLAAEYRLAMQKAEAVAAGCAPSRQNLSRRNQAAISVAEKAYRGPLREWLHAYWSADPERIDISAPSLWTKYNAANPTAADASRSTHQYWPNEEAAKKAVQAIKAEWRAANPEPIADQEQ